MRKHHPYPIIPFHCSRRNSLSHYIVLPIATLGGALLLFILGIVIVGMPEYFNQGESGYLLMGGAALLFILFVQLLLKVLISSTQLANGMIIHRAIHSRKELPLSLISEIHLRIPRYASLMFGIIDYGFGYLEDMSGNLIGSSPIMFEIYIYCDKRPPIKLSYPMKSSIQIIYLLLKHSRTTAVYFNKSSLNAESLLQELEKRDSWNLLLSEPHNRSLVRFCKLLKDNMSPKGGGRKCVMVPQKRTRR